jgi:hypothetical protein
MREPAQTEMVMTTNWTRVTLRGAVLVLLVTYGAQHDTPKALSSHYERLLHMPAEFLHQVPEPMNVDQVLAAIGR